MHLAKCMICALILTCAYFIVQRQGQSFGFVQRLQFEWHDLFSGDSLLIIIFIVTLSLLTCFGYTCWRWCRWQTSFSQNVGLDVYAPRTLSIVWPPLPEVTAYVIEMTYLHTPDCKDCLCADCALKPPYHTIKIDNCGQSTEC